MRIEQSDLKLTSHQASSSESWKSLQIAEGSASADPSQTPFSAFFNQELSALARFMPQTDAKQEEAMKEVDKSQTQRFQSLWEMLFGNHTSSQSTPTCPEKPTAAATANSPLSTTAKAQPITLQVMAIEHSKSSESCSFNASGKVCLQDGSTRQFDVAYQNAQSSESTKILGAEWLTLKDPLVIDMGPATTKLSQQSVDFDLDNDGKKESMRLPDASSGLLFLDKNHNGVADNGSELFGPQSGNGFSDLARLDDDHNGWIDEGDTAYKDLKLWQSGDQPAGRVQTLAQAGVGAMATTSVQTEYGIKENEQLLGQIRASSVWLGEHGGAGSVRQIDLATKPLA
ncbi:hypothetical protein [Iodobacter fluviatilis]|uniref:Uncharacterized protein n=1 Tax=Iodobacter fluviatilis TaxID=537 RepID=A0A377Q3M9_9NEIS|nr:hypothetical protein [Iodobacter fluviatilis]TCU90331.1 hypothetical protein EV682_101357 [Iodobacter fluviatilis]STQ89358.1 Uncharacterised protein [Iodobacter fluviatilis]